MPYASPSDSAASSPLTVLSCSPDPPDFRYPSPSSSQDLPGDEASNDGAAEVPNEGPPRKRRRVEPKPRTTEYLSLQTTERGIPYAPYNTSDHDRMQLDRLLKVLRTKKKIVVIAGAGISVSAGIPDFRSQTGLFKQKGSGKHMFDASVYQNAGATADFHAMVRDLSDLTKVAEPTPFHHLLATLAKEKRLLRLYSQNVDGLETRLDHLDTTVPLNRKGPWPVTIQLHGGLNKIECVKCHHLSNFDATLFEGCEPPTCQVCEVNDAVRTTHAGKRSHGIGKLRPRMVLYNEFNPDDEAIGAVTQADLKSRPDAVIVVGTSLKIPGLRRIVKEMCSVVRGRRDGMAIWLNTDRVAGGREFEKCWDLVVQGESDELARRVNLPRFNEEAGRYATEEEKIRATTVQPDFNIVIQTTRKDSSVLPTPISTPRQNKAHLLEAIQLEGHRSAHSSHEAPEGVDRPSTPKLKGLQPVKKAGAAKAVTKAKADAKSTKTRKRKTPQNTTISKITSKFKTSKTVAVVEIKRPATPPPNHTLEAISPSDARVNGHSSSHSESSEWKGRRRDEITPPKGTPPFNMRNILHLS